MLLQKTNINLNSKSSKCGEIHFSANNLSFVCIICELVIESFLEFRLHFENLHLANFVLQPKEKSAKDLENFLDEDILKSTGSVETTNERFNDPLNWICDRKGIKKILSDELNVLTTTSPTIEAESNSEKLEQNLQLDFDSDCSVKSFNSLSISDNILNNDFKVEWDKPYKPTHNHLKRPYKPRDKPIACTYCGRTFRRRYQLDTHLNIHTGEKPHQCEICGRRFRALTTLQRHLNTHEKRTDHACQFCDKRFTHRAALLSHESRHVQKRTVCCDECEKKFYTPNQCDTHKRRVHNKSNAALPSLPFACDICTNRYRTASMLSTHKFRKHLKTAKFLCDKCDKKFVDQSKLEEHQKIHTNKVEEM